MNTSNNKPVFSIGEAARITGVTIKQLRHWENKKYFPELARVVCGERSYRQYNSSDLQIISRIKAYLDEGYTLQSAARKTQNDFNYQGGKDEPATTTKSSSAHSWTNNAFRETAQFTTTNSGNVTLKF